MIYGSLTWSHLKDTMAKLSLLFLWLSELLCPSAAGRAISPKRSATPDTGLIFKSHNKILLPLPGEIPPLRRSLGARSLSLRPTAQDGGTAARAAEGGRVPSCAVPHRLPQALPRAGWHRTGQRLRAHADASSWGPAARPHLPLSGCSRSGGGGASRRSRRGCRAGTAMPWLSEPPGVGGQLRRLWAVSVWLWAAGQRTAAARSCWRSERRWVRSRGYVLGEPGVRARSGAGRAGHPQVSVRAVWMLLY